jgi:ribose transport system permease protein
VKKILGILGLLVVVFAATALLNRHFLSAYNLQNLVSWTSLFGIISIGVAFVIITGGIDLSIGSVIGLVGSLLAWLLTHQGWNVPVALLAVLLVSLAIGLGHGLLITKVRLQPFVVTLCGLLLYRGIARYLTDDQSQGFGNDFDNLRQLAIGKLPLTGTFALPAPFFFLLGVAVLAGLFHDLGPLSAGAGPKRNRRAVQRHPDGPHEDPGLHHLLPASRGGRRPLFSGSQFHPALRPG